MDTNTDLLGRLREDWRRIGRSPESVAALADLQQRHPELPTAGARDLGDLVEALDRRGRLRTLEKVAVIRALLEDADSPIIHRALLQTLLPGVVSVCRELRFGDGVVDRPSDLLNEAISTACELLSDWAGQSRPYAAPDLLSALRGRVRRWLLKEKELRATGGAEPVERAAEESSTLLARLAGHRGGPHDRLARLTYERVFMDRSWKELAAADHSSPVALQSELRQFALQFLL